MGVQPTFSRRPRHCALVRISGREPKLKVVKRCYFIAAIVATLFLLESFLPFPLF